MFKNIGKKIKILAQVITWINILAFFVLGMALMDLSELAGFLVMIIGVIVSWLSSFLLYGFGQLIDNSDKLVRCQALSLQSPASIINVDAEKLAELQKWRESGLITEEEYQQMVNNL